MKKLLKSILIATASIGTIAGSTAAVVSCGQEDNTPTDVSQYKSTLDTVSISIAAQGSAAIQNLPSLDGSLHIAWKYALSDNNTTSPADTSYKLVSAGIENLSTSNGKYLWIKLFSTNSHSLSDDISKSFQINLPQTGNTISISADFVTQTKNTLLEFITDPNNANNIKIGKILHIPQAPINTKWQAGVSEDNITAPTVYIDFSQVQLGTSLDEGKYIWIKLVPDGVYTLSNQATVTKLICKTKLNLSPNFQPGYVSELQDGNSWIVANANNQIVKYKFDSTLPDNRFQIDTAFGTSGIFQPAIGGILKIYKSGTGYLLVGVSGIIKITSSGQADKNWNGGTVRQVTQIVASSMTSDGGVYFIHGTPGTVSFLDNAGVYSQVLNQTGVTVPGAKFSQITNITTDQNNNAIVLFNDPLNNRTHVQEIRKDGTVPQPIPLITFFSNIFDVVKTSVGYFYFAAQTTKGNTGITAVFHLNNDLSLDNTFGNSGEYDTNIQINSDSFKTFSYYVDEAASTIVIGGSINSGASVQLERISFTGVLDTKFVSDQTDGKLVLGLSKLSGITRLNDNDYFLFSDLGLTKL